MAAIAKRLFVPAQLTGSLATYYSAPALTRTVIKKMTLTNTNDSTAYTVNVHLVPVGGAADNTNLLLNDVTLGAGETLEVFAAEGHVMNAGDFFQASASSAAQITFAASGVEITS